MVNRHDLTLDCTVKDGVCLKKGKEWMIVLYILGVFYMFIALAIVCDEFFVPGEARDFVWPRRAVACILAHAARSQRWT